MLPQFFDEDFADRQVVVKEGDEISLGSHSLTFVMAPMVHWPEVMVAYEKTENSDCIICRKSGSARSGVGWIFRQI